MSGVRRLREKVGLVASVKVALGAFHIERLRMIDEFDYSKVSPKTQQELAEKGLEVDQQYLASGIHALKQYYAVALLDPDNMHAVSERVDPFWHSHIVFTRDYVSFCDRIFGEYIHHEPLNKQDSLEVAKVRQLYSYTHGIYQRLFREVDPQWWPDPENAGQVCTHCLVMEPDIVARALFPRHPVTGCYLMLKGAA